jgi:hypothetical protein
MAESQESVTLSPETMKIVEGLRRDGSYGGNKKSGVLRYLIEEAIKQLVREDFVTKRRALLKALKQD